MRNIKKLVYGVGLDDADYPVKKDLKVICPFYKRWHNMLQRCYSETYHKKHPTYKDCKVCDEWLTFSNFRAWMLSQDWEGKHLDKDVIAPGNKIYSSEKCMFIPDSINSFFRRSKKKDAPIGVFVDTVTLKSGAVSILYKASLSGSYLGYESTPIKAHQKWQRAKLKQIEDLMLTAIDSRIRRRLELSHRKIMQDLENEIETKSY